MKIYKYSRMRSTFLIIIVWLTSILAVFSNSSINNYTSAGDPLEINLIQIIHVTCFGGNNGSITIEVIGGIEPYAISWSNGPISETNANLTAGSYSVTVVDGVGETVIQSYQVNQPAQLNAGINSHGNLDCVNTQITLTANANGGTPGYSFNWSNGQSGASIIVNTPGSYIVTVTDQNNCTRTAQTSVSQNNTPPSISAGSNQSINCPGQSIQLQGSGPTGGQYQISWSTTNGNIVSGGTTYTPTVNQAGTYQLEVVDLNNGCVSTASTTVTSSPPLNITFTTNNVTCNGQSNGSITANVTGGTPGYTYNWSNGQSGQTANNLGPGTFTVTVTDQNGCTGTGSASVSQPAAIQVSVSTTHQMMVGSNDGTATATASGGTGTLSYAWNTGGTTPAITGLAPGIYTVTVTDANGCSQTSSGVVNEVVCSVVAQVNTTSPITCFGANNGVLTALGSNGNTPYQYIWSNGPTTATNSNLGPGTYTVTVTDAAGCTATASGTLTQPEALNVNLNVQQMTGVGANNGSIAATPSGGTPNYTYAWSNGATTSTISNLSPGTYTVTVTDANGCQNTATGTINQINCTIAVSLNVSNPILCFGNNTGAINSSVTGASGNVTYAWNNGASTASISNLTAGNYTLTVTDALNCTATAQISITQPAQLNVTVNTTNVSAVGANDGTATALVQGGVGPYQYAWNTGAMISMISNLPPGTYTVTVTDANGCTSVTTGQVNDINCNLNVTIAATQPISCAGQADGTLSASVTGANGAVSYLWSTGATTASIQNLPAGLYSVTATDATNCISIADFNLTQPANLILTVNTTPVSGPNSNNATATAIVTGGTSPYAYLWSTGQTTTSVGGLAPGTYGLTVTDANGCTSNQSFSIDEFQCTLIVTINATGNIVCHGYLTGVLEALATGGNGSIMYTWSNDVSTAVNNNLGAGTYSVTVEDQSGCTATATANLTEPDPINLTLIATNISMVGATDGSIVSTVTGGTGDYSYSWSNGATTSNVTGLVPGTYMLTVTDENGCTKTASAIIEGIQCSLDATIVLVNDIICFGTNNGSLTVTVEGGNAPVTFVWSNGSTSQTLTGLTSGNYSVTSTDALGCTDSASYQLNSPTQISIQLSVEGMSGVGTNDGSISATVTGGTPPYTYNWSNGASTPIIEDLAPANYILTVTDANGCTRVASALINPFGCDISIDITQEEEILCFGDSTASITVITVGGEGPFTYQWSLDTSDGPELSGLAAGEYIITVTDVNGCIQIDSIQVSQPTAISMQVQVVQESSVGANDGSIEILSITGGTGAYSWIWSNGVSDVNMVTGLAPGEYCVTISDENNCAHIRCFTLSAFECNLTAEVNIVQHVSCFGGNDGAVNLVFEGGFPPYSVEWNGTDEVNVDALQAGDYEFTVVDGSGCTASNAFNITEPDILEVDVVQITEEIITQGTGAIQLQVEGGTPPYNFNWNLDGIQIPELDSDNLTDLTSGFYQVIIADANDCQVFIDSLIIRLITSISHSAVFGSVSLFPNPAGNHTTILLENQPSEIATYKIFNSAGKLLDSGIVNGTQGEYRIVLTNLPGGMYLIELALPQGKLSKIFVKE